MRDMYEEFRLNEAEIAKNVMAPPGVIARVTAISTRRRRRRQAGMVASSAAGAGLLVAVALAWWPMVDQAPIAPTVSESQSPVASKSVNPTPTVSADPIATVIDGFAPVPQLSADLIPWDKVGPGWFLVDWRGAVEAQPLEYEDTYTYPKIAGGLSLVSPRGEWYAANVLEALGTGIPMAWDGDNVWMSTAVTWGPDVGSYDLALVDLSTRKATGVTTGVPWEMGAPFAPGKALVYGWGGDGLFNIVDGVGVDGAGGCSQAGSGFWGWEAADMSFLYSSSDGGRIVCFGPATDSTRTAVTLVDVGDVSASRIINEFHNDSYHYSFVGWVDADSFLFQRIDPISRAAEQLYRYDLASDAITEVSLDLYSGNAGSRVEGYFDRVSQRFVTERFDGDAWSVDIHTLEGSKVATVAGTCAKDEQRLRPVDVLTSGERMMVVCPNPGYVQLFDLQSGAQIGHWELGSDRVLEVFDHPDN